MWDQGGDCLKTLRSLVDVRLWSTIFLRCLGVTLGLGPHLAWLFCPLHSNMLAALYLL